MKKLILILALSSLCVAGQRVVSLSISNRIVMIAPSKDTVFVIVDTTPKPSKINWDSLSYWLDEDRFIMLGLSFKLRMLVVCYCTRKATRHEADNYRKG